MTQEANKSKRPVWLRCLKWAGIAAATAVMLIIIVCTLVVWILTPGKLTPIVEKAASEYLNAEVRASRIELTFWHTFPQLTVDVDSLSIVSRSLESLPDSIRSGLPADADSLLTLKHFHGGINLLPLLTAELSLHDVEFINPRINLLQVDNTKANFMIVPPSPQPEQPQDTTEVKLPKISINRFRIVGAEPIRYRSPADSLDFALNLKNLGLDSQGEPTYALSLLGDVNSPMLNRFNFDSVTFGADGRIEWDCRRPMAVRIADFVLKLHRYSATLNAAVDFTDQPIVTEFAAKTAEIPVTELLSHLPQELTAYTKPLKSEMTARVDVSLTQAWNLTDSLLPSVRGAITIPGCTVDYQTLHLDKFAAELEFDFDGTNMDASVFNLKRLMTDGAGVAFNLSTKVTRPLSDPRIKGTFNGTLNFARLPEAVRKQIPGSLKGTLEGRTDFALRLSDFSRENFHRMNVRGQIELHDFDADMAQAGRAYTHHAQLDFGSNSRYITNTQHTIDSLLTISLKVDTLSAQVEGIDLQMRNFRAGAGSINRRASADTTEINPFGMKIEAERLKFESPADTLRLRMRNASISGSLQRYKGEARLPLMNLNIAIDRLMAGQALNKVSLRKANVDMTLHARPKRKRRTTASDSIRMARRRAAARVARADTLHVEEITFDIDSTERRLLRQWNYKGHMTARGGRIVTPYFPLRNSLRHIDLRFNQDSIVLDSLRYRAGQSDFLVNGTISNLRRALTSRRNNTLGLSLSLSSDTVNVNEIVNALFAGTAISQQTDSSMIWAENDSIDMHLDQMADTAETGPLLLPHNIDATFSLKADNVLYSDLILSDLKGEMMIYDGALNLRNLSASADIGSLSLDGLYDGGRADSLQFGMGMKVTDFRLDRLSAIIPAIDSLMPMMRNFGGIVNADMAITTDIATNMDIKIPTLKAAIKLEGDSLVLLDPETFKSISKWLLFRDKQRNMIDHMSVEVVVDNSTVELYPFMFNIDRYRLGVMGSNDLAMNMNYHISVLKSPIPFKFGINIKGTPEKMKIRLGGAKVKENMIGERQTIADNTRINIVKQINSVFRKGVKQARKGRLSFREAAGAKARASAAAQGALLESEQEHLSYQDSLQFIREGLIENPDTLRFPPAAPKN